ncbi:hypothetical protein FGO68_gene15937 [Halteria grandinella]|uniref:Uncharacterized protein n=1 Tax=Halteria grandinella TaxID=5974 RepID=A0A8J8NWR4_HALGN|nr:hypothetical protein FGO68_gene15937 [Halteria grandinella]
MAMQSLISFSVSSKQEQHKKLRFESHLSLRRPITDFITFFSAFMTVYLNNQQFQVKNILKPKEIEARSTASDQQKAYPIISKLMFLLGKRGKGLSLILQQRTSRKASSTGRPIFVSSVTDKWGRYPSSCPLLLYPLYLKKKTARQSVFK